MNQFDPNLIIAIQKLSCPFLDFLFYFVTLIGSEYFFLAAAAIIFWCLNKRQGYKFFIVFILGQFVVGAVKFLVSRPRPYTQKGIKSIFEETEGGSFPSGHSHNAANMSTQLCLSARNYKNSCFRTFRRALIVGCFATIFVMFSRMYLGQHYLSDVLFGAFLGVICALVFSLFFDMLKNKEEFLFLTLLPLSIIGAAICVVLAKNPEAIVRVLAILGAMSLGYFLEKRYIGYNVSSGAWHKHLIKIILGILMLLLVKEGVRFAFSNVNSSLRAQILLDFIRYFLLGIVASLAAPAFFKAVKL